MDKQSEKQTLIIKTEWWCPEGKETGERVKCIQGSVVREYMETRLLLILMYADVKAWYSGSLS